MCRMINSVARKSTARCGYGSSTPNIQPEEFAYCSPGILSTYHATVCPLAFTQDHSRFSRVFVRQLQLYSCPSEATNFRWRGPPISTRNAAIVCVRGEPPWPMVVTFPSAPAAPYSRVTTGMSGSVENMLYTPYDDAPSASRRVQRTRRYMRSYKSTNSEPDSEPDLSSSMNGMPVKIGR